VGDFEEFYFGIWAAEMADAAEHLGVKGVVPERQLAFLREAGFANVDCYFKSGIFAVFGGMRAGSGSNVDVR
jgi:hypothetical protein